MAKLSWAFCNDFYWCVFVCVCAHARVCLHMHLCASVAGFNLMVNIVVEGCGLEYSRGQGIAGDIKLTIDVNFLYISCGIGCWLLPSF